MGERPDETGIFSFGIFFIVHEEVYFEVVDELEEFEVEEGAPDKKESSV